jgi:hypothetical protein
MEVLWFLGGLFILNNLFSVFFFLLRGCSKLYGVTCVLFFPRLVELNLFGYDYIFLLV